MNLSVLEVTASITTLVLAAVTVAQYLVRRREYSTRIADLDATYSLAYAAIELVDRSIDAAEKGEVKRALRCVHQAKGAVDGVRSLCQARTTELAGRPPKHMHPGRCEQLPFAVEAPVQNTE